MWGFPNLKNRQHGMKIYHEITSFKTKFNSTSNPSIILRDSLDDNILDTAYVYDIYYCEKFGTFPFLLMFNQVIFVQ